MARDWTPGSNVSYACPVVGQEVSIGVSTCSIYGQGQFPIDIVQRMDSCTGNAICKKFPGQVFSTLVHSNGCPAHEMYGGGS
jgi:hypothetical protein